MAAAKNPPDDRRPTRPGMLDLPLRPGEDRPAARKGPAAAPEDPGARPRRPLAAEPEPDVRWVPEQRARRSHPGRWIAAILLLAAGALVGWFVLEPTPAEAVFTPSALEFEERRVGTSTDPLELTVANRGERPMILDALRLAGDAPEDFIVERDECTGVPRATGESCTVALRFEPRAAGVRRAVLELVGNLGRGVKSAPLLGRGAAPVIGLDRTELEFGGQQVGGATDPGAVEVANLGSAPLEIARVRLVGEHAGDFALSDGCSRRTVAPGRTCRLEVTFRPRAAGDKEARLEISSDSAGEGQAVSLTGLGLWTGPAFQAAPAQIDFGEQRVGRAAEPRETVLTNRSAAPASIAGIAASGDGFEVDGAGCLGRSLAPGATCRVRVTFTPAADGPAAGALTAREADGAGSRVALRGFGVSPRLTLQPESLDFGDLRAGRGAATRRLAVANPGRAPLAMETVALGGPDARLFDLRVDDCSRRSVPANGSCALEVAFRPERPEIARARLTVTSDAPDGARSVALTGRGTAPALTLDRQRLDFGEVLRGSSASGALAFSNSGSAALDVQAVRVEGGDRGDFRVTDISCRLDDGLAPGRRCPVTVRFAPAAEGPRSAKLVLRHDGPSSPDEVWLFGTGREPLPGFELSPRSLRFDDVAVGQRGRIETLTVRNPGAGRLVLREIGLSGADAADFQIVPGSCEGAPSIAPESSCTVGLRFAPLAAGDRRATLVVRHNAPGRSGEASLSGRGVGPPEP